MKYIFYNIKQNTFLFIIIGQKQSLIILIYNFKTVSQNSLKPWSLKTLKSRLNQTFKIIDIGFVVKT